MKVLGFNISISRDRVSKVHAKSMDPQLAACRARTSR